MRYFMLLLLVIFCLGQATGQGFTKKVFLNKDLSIFFTTTPDTMNRDGVFGYYENSKGISYQAFTVTKGEKLSVKSRTDFKSLLKRMANELQGNRSLKLLDDKKIIDTVIGGAEGKFFHGYSTRGASEFKEVLFFMTIRSEQIYSIQVFMSEDAVADPKKIADFFSGATFYGKGYPATIEDSAAYKFGYYIGFLIIPVIVILVIVYFVRRYKK